MSASSTPSNKMEKNQRSIRDWIALEAEAQEQLGKRGGAFTTELEARQYMDVFGQAPRRILDIGGAKGDFTAHCRALYPNAQIVLVEPSRKQTDALRARFAGDPRIVVEVSAAGHAPGTGMLYADEPGSELASLTRRDLRHLRRRFDPVEEVVIRTIDDIAGAHFGDAGIDLIKLDVEGHELDCLHGATNTLPSCNAVQFEFGGCNIDTRTYLKDFFLFFEKFGFELKRISPLGLIPLPAYREHLESFMTSNYLAVRSAQD